MIADRISKGLSEEAQKAKEGVTLLGTEGQRQIQAGTVAPEPELVSRAASRPAEFVQNPADVERFTRQRTAQYAGPSSLGMLAQYEPAQKGVTQAQQKAKLTDTEAGRLELLRGTMTKPTGGTVALNQLLMQGDPTAAAKIQATKPAFGELESYLSGTTGSLAEAIAKGKEASQKSAQGVQEALYGAQGAIPGLQQAVTSRVEPAEAERNRINSLIQGITAKLMTNQPLTAQEYTAIGMYPQQMAAIERGTTDIGRFYPSIMRASPPDLTQFLTGGRLGAEPATAATMASPEEYAREKALETLAGKELPILPTATPEMAGTYQGPTMPTYQTPEALKAFEDAIRGYDEEYLRNIQGASTMRMYMDPYEIQQSEAGMFPERFKMLQERLKLPYSLAPERPVPETPPVPPPDEAHNMPIYDENGNIVGWVGRRGPVRGGA